MSARPRRGANLFEAAGLDEDAPRPLADRLRPAQLSDVVGQDHLLGPDGALTRMLATRSLGSLVFWGPPGTGKTTVARLLANATALHFEQISAVFSGVADLKKTFDAARAGGIARLLEIRNTAEHCGNLLEVERGRGREQPRHRGLAGAGRPPEHEGAERARREHAGERTVGSEQMVLADDVGELGRAQLVGERARRVLLEARGLEKVGPAARARVHPRNSALIRCPPRRIVTFQVRVDAPAARSRSRVFAIGCSFTLTITSPRWKP
jgi:hypothetical protein